MRDDDALPAREWPIPPMDHAAGYKGTAFTWAMGRLILSRIAEGETVKAITADARMPAHCTVFQWMRVVPEFGAAVRRARVLLAASRLAYREAERQALLETRAKRGGRRRRGPSTKGPCSAEALDRLLTELRDGASLNVATARPGAPSFRVIYARVRTCPGFRTAFLDACEWRRLDLELKRHRVIDEVAAMGFRATDAELGRLRALQGRQTPKLYRLPSARAAK